MREFRTEENELKRGDKIDINTFVSGDIVRVTSISKGKGFQGVVKRHGFSGSKTTHGNKDQTRMPGSIGATGPAHVFKGTKMGGRMGGDQVTVTNLEIIEVDKDNNILSIKGAIPGGRNSLVLIKGEGELKVESQKVESRPSAGEAGKSDVDDEKEKKVEPFSAEASAGKKAIEGKEGAEEKPAVEKEAKKTEDKK